MLMILNTYYFNNSNNNTDDTYDGKTSDIRMMFSRLGN